MKAQDERNVFVRNSVRSQTNSCAVCVPQLSERDQYFRVVGVQQIDDTDRAATSTEFSLTLTPG